MKITKEQLLQESTLTANAYWISPYGKIVDVPTYHINHIIQNPTIYGYTEEEINSIYEKHQEPKGLEGKAREEIMSDVINKGWIRIRFIKKQYTWIVQLKKLDNKKKDYLQQWATEIEKSFPNTDCNISTNTEYITKSTIDISNDVLFNESTRDYRYILEHVNNFTIKDKQILKKV